MATIAADYSEQIGSRNTERVSTQEHSNQERNALHSREGRIGVLSHAYSFYDTCGDNTGER